MAKESTTTTKDDKKKSSDQWKDMSVKEMKRELEKLHLDVRVGKEKNTSLVKGLKKLIAKKLTHERLQS